MITSIPIVVIQSYNRTVHFEVVLIFSVFLGKARRKHASESGSSSRLLLGKQYGTLHIFAMDRRHFEDRRRNVSVRYPEGMLAKVVIPSCSAEPRAILECVRAGTATWD